MSAPENATSPFASASASSTMPRRSTPCAVIIAGLSPAARIAVPKSVRRNQANTIAEHEREREEDDAERDVVRPRRGARNNAVESRRDRCAIEQRDVRSTHDVQIHRIERGHHENSGEQLVDSQGACEAHPSRTRHHAREERNDRRDERIHAADDQRRSHRGAERETSVGSDVGKSEHARRDVDAPRQRREREPENERREPELPWRRVRGSRRGRAASSTRLPPCRASRGITCDARLMTSAESSRRNRPPRRDRRPFSESLMCGTECFAGLSPRRTRIINCPCA